MAGAIGADRCLPGSGRALPRPPRRGANPVGSPLQLSRFLLRRRPAALPQPRGPAVPSRAPARRRRGAGGRRGARGVSTCMRRARAVGAAARRGSRSRSRSQDGAAGPGRHGRRGAAPLLTTQLPAPHRRRPARARARGPPAPGCQSGEAPRSRSPDLAGPSPGYLQSSAPRLGLHILPALLIFFPPRARSVSVFPSCQPRSASACIPPREPRSGRDAGGSLTAAHPADVSASPNCCHRDVPSQLLPIHHPLNSCPSDLTARDPRSEARVPDSTS